MKACPSVTASSLRMCHTRASGPDIPRPCPQESLKVNTAYMSHVDKMLITCYCIVKNLKILGRSQGAKLHRIPECYVSAQAAQSC